MNQRCFRFDQEGIIEVLGNLDDDFDFQGLKQSIVRVSHGRAKLTFDFSQAAIISSFGIVNLIECLNTIAVPLEFQGCRPSLIMVMNLEIRLQDPRFTVLSIYAPYFCEQTDASRTQLLQIGKDVPRQQTKGHLSLPTFHEDGLVWIPDFDPEDYLAFLLGWAEPDAS